VKFATGAGGTPPDLTLNRTSSYQKKSSSAFVPPMPPHVGLKSNSSKGWAASKFTVV